MPKFNFRKSILNPLKSAASPYVNQALGELKTKGLDAFKQLSSSALQTLTDTPVPVFKNGGTIKGARGRPKIIQAHAGEYVLPLGVKPTVAQKKAVAKRKAKARK